MTHQAPDPTRVTNLNDAGPGSLRQAIDTAPAGSTITFDASLSGTIRLTSSDLSITKNLTIQGPVTRTIAVSSGSSGHLIAVLPGASAAISNLIFKDSKLESVIGSFIINEGTLILTNSTVSGNTTSGLHGGGGGGIYNEYGRLTLTNSTVSGNTVQSGSGRIVPGGGIYNFGGILTLTNSTVSGNTASTGGGIANDGILTLTNSTVSGNTASGTGGGITNDYSAQTVITFSTITDNMGPVGADIAIVGQGGQVTISKSIVVGDRDSAGPDISGRLTSSGYNLFQVNSGATFDPSTAALHRTDTLLSANELSRLFGSLVGLRNNGGPTLTYALAPGSTAIDAIPLQDCQLKAIFDSQSRLYTDQRGLPRPDGNERACDIGAFEYVDA